MLRQAHTDPSQRMYVVAQLQDKLQVHDKGKETSRKSKQNIDKGKQFTPLTLNELVMLRIPGLHAALENSWEGPYKVLECLGPTNVKVCKEGDEKRTKVVHVNNTKRYANTEAMINMTVIAEDESSVEKTVLTDECSDYDEREIVKLEDKYSRLFSDVPGTSNVASLSIHVREDSDSVPESSFHSC